jgi:D-amino-acid oxidase
MSFPNRDVLVLGAGVSGLSSAILLRQAGYDVRIWARELPPETTSNRAAAIWYPYLAQPREKALRWAAASYAHFAEQLVPDPASGVSFQSMTEIFAELQPEPWWQSAVPLAVERPAADELPPGYVDAYRFQGLLIETDIYMPFLLDSFRAFGGSIEQREISAIDDALDAADVVVNCTGLGSRDLVGDEDLYPVRGQMLRVHPTGLTETVFDDTGPNALGLVVPRSGDLLLGGSTQDQDWNREPDPADTQSILQRARAIAPDLGDIEILDTIVGLRPVRSQVRLEAERVGEKQLVHNYGHGGAGFTLSWGCAQDVVDLVTGNS